MWRKPIAGAVRLTVRSVRAVLALMRRFRPLLAAFLVLLGWSASLLSASSLTANVAAKGVSEQSQLDPTNVPHGAWTSLAGSDLNILDDDDGCSGAEPPECFVAKSQWSGTDIVHQRTRPRLADRRLTTLVGSVVLLI